MNIETIINSLPLENIFEIEDINPTTETINDNFINNVNIKVIKYNKQFFVDVMDESQLFTNPGKMNKYPYYILCSYNKEINDVITNIKCNYKFNIVLENNMNISELVSTNIILKTFFKTFPLFENYLNKSFEFNENSIIVMLPILFMINTQIKIKVFFNSIDEYSKSKIEFKYECYTFSNDFLKELGSKYKECKFISNDRGMIFKDGILKHDYDLD